MNAKSTRTGTVTFLVLAMGCATVKMSQVRPDYDLGDKQRVRRLAVVVQPLPDGNPRVGELWSLLARRYVNQKRDFIAKENQALAKGSFDLRAHCGGNLEGVLWLAPELKKSGEGMEVSAQGQLLRCPDGEQIWVAQAGGSWPSQDARLKEVTADYGRELGPEVEPYVAPAFNLLRPLLDTLPQPVLSDKDKDEKIELGE